VPTIDEFRYWSLGTTSNPHNRRYYYNHYLSFYKYIVCSENDNLAISGPLMVPRTVEKPLLQALAGQVLARPPLWLMRQAGRYLPEYRALRDKTRSFLEFCYTPDLAVEATLQPIRRFGMDGAILFSDILVIPDALGQKVDFRDGVGPILMPIRTAADLKALKKNRILDHLRPVFDTIKRLRLDIPASVALIGFAGAPWTVAVYMVEGRGGGDCDIVRAWARRSPGEFAVLIELLVDATADYLAEQTQSGVEVIQVFDSWAGVLDDDEFRRWVIEPTRRLVERLKTACPGVPVIGFPRGAGGRALAFVEETGVAAVSLDHTQSLDWIAKTLQPKCTVQGNLDNQALLAGGVVLEQRARDILAALGGGPFIFNLGHGVLPETPPEHVARLVEIVRGWSASAVERRVR
jgi:uroporphyrinogen decarboxylase